MQISGSVVTNTPSLTSKASTGATQKAMAAPFANQLPGTSCQDIDLSHITPRKLQTYIDERVMSGDIGDAEMTYCTTLFCSIPGEWYSEQPDVPVDVTSRIESMADFARDHGISSETKFYEGMLDWMKKIEAQSVRVSVFA